MPEKFAKKAASNQMMLDRLFDLSPDMVAIFDVNGNWVRVSRAWETVLGYPSEELLSRPIAEYIHPEDRAATLRDAPAELHATGKLSPYRNRYLHKDGSYRWLEWTGALSEADGQLFLFARDVTQAVDAQTLAEKTQNLTKAGGWTFDIPSGKVTWTKQVYDIHQVDPATFVPTPETVRRFFDLESLKKMDDGIRAAAESGTVYDEVLLSRTAKGENRWVRVIAECVYLNGKPVRIFGTTQDIDERRKTEDRLNQYQKLESIGRLAGGIAHDFNNILAVIAGHAAMLSLEMKGDPRAEKIDKIMNSIDRASGLTHQLLAYSRQQAIRPKPMDLAEAVRESGELMTRLIGGNVQVEVVTPEIPAVVLGDPSQITQILLNLGINARDALRTDDDRISGRIRFVLQETSVQAQCPWNDRGLSAGNYWHLSVIDNGCGMDPATSRQAFEPFFTTKEFGKGTGLGLATVYGIVQQLRGHIQIDTELMQGTTIHVFFPKLERLDVKAKVHDVPVADDIFLAFQP
ncbi:MAG: PAS domain S-box protein [Bdellovibrionales bacterium]|nr:PAS domain S-box protein [Bdellovibrionales bacterium]